MGAALSGFLSAARAWSNHSSSSARVRLTKSTPVRRRLRSSKQQHQASSLKPIRAGDLLNRTPRRLAVRRRFRASAARLLTPLWTARGMHAAMAIRPQALLCPRPEGLYCPPGDFFIDPVRPVERAVITHGHSRPCPRRATLALATHATLDIMAVRYGDGFAGRAQALTLRRDASIATGWRSGWSRQGHVLGSAQVVVSWKGLTIVVSGDYKRRRDPTCDALRAASHATSSSARRRSRLPVFRHPPDTRRDRQADEVGRAVPGADATWSAPMRSARRSG